MRRVPIQRVLDTIEERALLARGDDVLVACSGGSDSTALVAMLARLVTRLGITVEVASIDHGLRAESSSEVAAVGRLADALGLGFVSARLDLAPGPGVQARARRARYAALHELARARRCNRIATGHTLDDQAETVLMRVLRGGGLPTLVGIEPHRSDGVVRPLLDCRREELRGFLAAEGLLYVDDPTNADLHYTRARVRHRVLPMLESLEPEAARRIAHLADEARTFRSTLGREADRLLRDAGVHGGGVLSAEVLDRAGSARRGVLRAWLEAQTGRPPRSSHVEAIEGGLGSRRAGRAGPAEVALAGNATARVHADRVEIVPRAAGSMRSVRSGRNSVLTDRVSRSAR